MTSRAFRTAFYRRRNLLSALGALLVSVGMLAACRGDGDDSDYGLGPDQDGDGWPLELDCDDRDETVFPSADDVPGDDIDQDCSGSDGKNLGLGGEGGGSIGSGGSEQTGGFGGEDHGAGGSPDSGNDGDGDGHFAPPEGEDCDDERPEVHPGGVELLLNGIDENCDGSDLVGLVGALPFSGEDALLGEAPDLATVEIDGQAHLLAIWADSRTAPRQDVYGQILTLEGEKVGAEVAIDVADNNAKSDVRLVSKGDGFLAVWSTAEGVFAQQLNEDGSTRGILFGIDDAGAQFPVPAYGGWDTEDGGAWAIAWRRPGDGPGTQGRLRAMSTDTAAVRAPIVDLGGASDTVNGVSIAGTQQGFLAVWEGPAGDGRGLIGQETDRVGELASDPTTVFEGAVSDPAVAYDGQEFLAVFRTGSAFGYAAGRAFADLADLGDVSESIRLSSESTGQEDFRVTFSENAFFTLWNDSRHWGHNPSIDSVYGNAWNDESGARWSYSRAFFADEDAELGGVAVVGSTMYLAVQSDGVGYLVRQPVD